ncbi:MAG TPA: preprotein translocase subunit SecG [Nitrospinae bacterium]|nr:preprotein translocase subunit SecG [Nitrospinota bacterium]
MSIFLTILHVTVAISLILFVLLQAGKGAGIGAAFGGSSDTLFGASGPAGILGKLTTAAAILFMMTSLLLSYAGAQKQTRSIAIETPVRSKTKSRSPAKPSAAPAKPQKSGKSGS